MRNYYHNPTIHGYADVALYVNRAAGNGAPDWHINTQYAQIQPHCADAPAHGADDQTILAEARAVLAADVARRNAAREAAEISRHGIGEQLDAEFAAKEAAMRRGGWGE